MSENLEVVRRANAAVNRGDLEALRELLHPDMEWEDSAPAGDGAIGAGSQQRDPLDRRVAQRV
jgi:ketosteroid isomerase-like protein